MHYKYILLILFFCSPHAWAEPIDISLSQEDLRNFNNYANQANAIVVDAKNKESNTQITLPNIITEDTKACQSAFYGMQDIISKKIPFNNTQQKAQVYIFVSFSMPEVSLQQWINQAAKINASIVVRGMYKNSMQETMQKVANFVQEKNIGGLGIDPISFTRFNISKVPAVVISKLQNQHDLNIMPQYDVVFGNGSLYTALEKLSESYLYGKDAKEYLTQLRTWHD